MCILVNQNLRYIFHELQFDLFVLDTPEQGPDEGQELIDVVLSLNNEGGCGDFLCGVFSCYVYTLVGSEYSRPMESVVEVHGITTDLEPLVAGWSELELLPSASSSLRALASSCSAIVKWDPRRQLVIHKITMMSGLLYLESECD
ncbi:hypothetical protein SFRURICE_003434 [Spodoptera frugiperda]|nr:hypothetical protein SFRURICE_003434 [Spodoptera frugiperda]